MLINYEYLHKSTVYYEQQGFQRLDVPWWVTPEVAALTKPSYVTAPDFIVSTNQKALIASGEQSFLYLAIKGMLPKGKYQTITPCFRNEPYDLTHRKHFIKNELIDTVDVSHVNMHRIVAMAGQFFESLLPDDMKDDLTIIEAPQCNSIINFDILLNGQEIGSYGLRDCEYLSWVYATGISEPRFSMAMQHN